MSNFLKKTLLVASLVPAASIAAAPGQPPVPSATPGPKVHVSDTKDTSGCEKLADQKAAVAGRTIGAIAGAKLGVGMMGTYAAAAAGEEAAVKATTAGRCSAKAEIGHDSAQPAQKLKKRKVRIPGLGF